MFVLSLDHIPQTGWACTEGHDCVEIRLDLLKRKQKLSRPPVPYILKTLDLSLLLSFDAPDYVDIDYRLGKAGVRFVRSHFPKAGVICSCHEKGKIKDIKKRLHELQNTGADFFKIVAGSFSYLESLQLAQLSNSQTVAFGVGEKGILSRYVALIQGAPFNYVCLSFKQATAKGQQPLNQWPKGLNRHTKIYALLGRDVSSSPSHITHNAAFQASNINSFFYKMSISPQELQPLLELALLLPFAGFAITLPFKEMVCSLCETSLKAVNTLVKKRGKWHGHMTDGEGGVDALKEVAPELNNKKVAILGAGGTAQALALALKKEHAIVTIVNRSPDRGREIAKRYDLHFCSLKGNWLDYDILIQATPVGMPPKTEEMVITKDQILPKTVVLDAIHTPERTYLLGIAQTKGCQIISGRRLFLYQALRQFVLWFGKRANITKMQEALETFLLEKNSNSSTLM